jgi:hypothetical protein
MLPILAAAAAVLPSGTCSPGDDSPAALASTATATPPPTNTPNPEPTATPTRRPLLQTDRCRPVDQIGKLGLAVTSGSLCLVWRDDWDSESGFRIVLQYEEQTLVGGNTTAGPGERFEYRIGPNQRDFVVPDADAPYSISKLPCGRRKDYAISLFVVFPGGREEPVDGLAVIPECGRP